MRSIEFISMQRDKYGKYKVRFFDQNKKFVEELKEQLRFNEFWRIEQELLKAQRKLREQEEPRLL
ncbi:hypothetical protein [Campylobacter pinnipediorum]|uniref:Uncharacterized protein n=1 Tax=Campylobacter pinnipediorum subsp. pinnipediorum TaxID=1660067 RepID=A0AAX0LA47_9BACT|nr:hypothetical protein [Campylobacter pinnipediorum]AQW81381.1 hypothetical protein CPIN17260_1092 [Campylobacter pinnipediorum subsp. pinnipediorum]AQW83007.1 hypothetical protein CPIN17261_1003 [Campylobacter pinnipediorum subsp. pinnipediorum]OPA77347.1 hypothetical protein BFG04_04435 [Campylobacter pinnipediorum subsp. pinnipediorum]